MIRGKKRGHGAYTGANVLALQDAGQSQVEISKNLGIAVNVVGAILRGEGKWAAIVGDAKIEAYRKEQRRQHELMAHELSTEALKRIETTLPKASVGQATMVFGVLQEKIKLITGEAAQNVRVAVSVEAEKLTDMLDKLVTSLKVGAAIDVTPPVETSGSLFLAKEPQCSPLTGK